MDATTATDGTGDTDAGGTQVGTGGGMTTGWLPIATAPKDRGILVYLADKGFCTLACWLPEPCGAEGAGDFFLPAMREWADHDGQGCLHRATHWMPLPEPPQ